MPASHDPSEPEHQAIVSEAEAGSRLDVFLAKHFPTHSRVQLRLAVVDGTVEVDGQRTKVAYRLNAGQCVRVSLPQLPRESPQPEDIPLDILYEDQHLVAVNKPAGMVVHPAKGHWSGTLTAALAFHFEKLSSVAGPSRPGIIHRLDRDTTGVILVAKTDAAHLRLAAQFEARTVKKQYQAIVVGEPQADRDWIDQPIGPHPHQREKMAIRSGHATSREAQTFFEVRHRWGRFSLVRAEPKTGRTHQIRLHLQHVGCPVVCDRLYGGRSVLTYGEWARIVNRPVPADPDDVLLQRQALHAERISFEHPVQGERMEIVAPLPNDMARFIELMK